MIRPINPLPDIRLEHNSEGGREIALQRRVYGNIRSRLQMHLRRIGYSDNGAASLLRWFLRCTAADLVRHLEAKMLPGMTWGNYSAGGWHIDHIEPLSSFDFWLASDVKAACHYSNLQPLWADWNISKGGANRK